MRFRLFWCHYYHFPGDPRPGSLTISKENVTGIVPANRKNNTCFEIRFVMGIADCVQHPLKIICHVIWPFA